MINRWTCQISSGSSKSRSSLLSHRNYWQKSTERRVWKLKIQMNFGSRPHIYLSVFLAIRRNLKRSKTRWRLSRSKSKRCRQIYYRGTGKTACCNVRWINLNSCTGSSIMSSSMSWRTSTKSRQMSTKTWRGFSYSNATELSRTTLTHSRGSSGTRRTSGNAMSRTLRSKIWRTSSWRKKCSRFKFKARCTWTTKPMPSFSSSNKKTLRMRAKRKCKRCDWSRRNSSRIMDNIMQCSTPSTWRSRRRSWTTSKGEKTHAPSAWNKFLKEQTQTIVMTISVSNASNKQLKIKATAHCVGENSRESKGREVHQFKSKVAGSTTQM